jgi:putative MFS transporter
LRAPPSGGLFWTAFIGLFFDYYDLYLFVYLERALVTSFGLSVGQAGLLQFGGLGAVGLGALAFGFLADRFGRQRILAIVFCLYTVALTGLSLAWNFEALIFFRVLASMALGAEWGISHVLIRDNVGPELRYRYSAFLQLAILGGLAAAIASRVALPEVGWRALFAGSIVPVVVLSLIRWRWLAHTDAKTESQPNHSRAGEAPLRSVSAGRVTVVFLQCLMLASLTIASGYINLFFAKELPQSVWYTVLFWANIAPGMLLGAWVVRKVGVRVALMIYACILIALSLTAWQQWLPGGKLTFAVVVPVLNGIPFGLMGAYFNEVFVRYRTMYSGAAYNLGRILAGFAPIVITALGLHEGGNYFLFSAALGVAVLSLAPWIKASRIGPPVQS